MKVATKIITCKIISFSAKSPRHGFEADKGTLQNNSCNVLWPLHKAFKETLQEKKIIAYKIITCTLMALVALSSDAYSQPVPLPGVYSPQMGLNFVKEFTPTAPISSEQVVPTRPVEEVKITTTYLDGLARPVQTVNKQASPLKKDMVTARIYDAVGREQYQYLPFISTPVTGSDVPNNGSFKLNAFQQQQAFMNAQYGSQGEMYFYGKTDYEASPLNRVQKTFAAGDSWVGTRGSSKEKAIRRQYSFNTTADAVRVFTIGTSPGSLPAAGGNYLPQDLYKTITIDEQANQTVEFKDREGNIILKKVQVAASVTDGHVGWLCTYYVYDHYNQLRFVLPPKATEAFLEGSSIAAIAAELCFSYAYDQHRRMIQKKVPGAAEVYMIYDQRDRLVMTQDGNLRAAGKWMVTLYDGLNRPTVTGLWNNNQPVGDHHTAAENSANYYYPFNESNMPSSGWELLTQMHYDDYTGLPASLTSSFQNDGAGVFSTSYNTAPLYAQEVKKSEATVNKVTWTRTKVLGTVNQYLTSVTLYDDKGRIIQVKSINQTGGTDIITHQYDWSGKLLYSVQRQQKAGTNG